MPTEMEAAAEILLQDAVDKSNLGNTKKCSFQLEWKNGSYMDAFTCWSAGAISMSYLYYYIYSCVAEPAE